MKTLKIKSPEEMERAALALLEGAGRPRVVTLEGEVGAGKTTLVQAFCRLQGVMEEVTSPTYALVNEYEGRDGTIFHLDLYRLRSLEEGLDMGLEEILESGAWCLVEWPALITPILPPDTLAIKLEIIGESARKVLLL